MSYLPLVFKHLDLEKGLSEEHDLKSVNCVS